MASDPEELLRSIERTREELANTVDTIAGRLDPKRVAKRGVDAMRDGGQLRISVRRSDEGRDLGLLVAIEDTGIGIPPENLSLLFEPFFTTKPAAGTGLGLWVVREFVASWGGAVSVASNIGSEIHGTTFTILLPSIAASDSSKKSQLRIM